LTVKSEIFVKLKKRKRRKKKQAILRSFRDDPCQTASLVLMRRGDSIGKRQPLAESEVWETNKVPFSPVKTRVTANFGSKVFPRSALVTIFSHICAMSETPQVVRRIPTLVQYCQRGESSPHQRDRHAVLSNVHCVAYSGISSC
jgi:hypothetical protein